MWGCVCGYLNRFCTRGKGRRDIGKEKEQREGWVRDKDGYREVKRGVGRLSGKEDGEE